MKNIINTIFSPHQSFNRFLGSFMPKMRLRLGFALEATEGAYSDSPDPSAGKRKLVVSFQKTPYHSPNSHTKSMYP